MNNKGFGLPEVLVFIGSSLFVLIVIAIYINNMNSNNTILTSSTSNSTNDTLVPNTIETPNEYIKLENKIKSAAKKYKFNKNENIIISLNKLKKANLLNKLTDPNDQNISCNGYVVYSSENKKYIAYINCPGMYSTNNYNSEFE